MSRPREFDPDTALDAAMQTFWTRGYEATSLPELLDATGLARQSLYNTFGGKRALYLACLRRYVETGAGRMAEAARGLPAREAIRASFQIVLAAPLADLRRGCFVVNSAAELAARDAEVARISAAALRQQERFFAEVLRKGVRDGELSLSQRRLEQTARFLMGALQGLRLVAKADPSSPALDDIVDVTLQVLL